MNIFPAKELSASWWRRLWAYPTHTIIFGKMPSTDESMIKLKDCEPFSSGGNRLCFRHPEHPDRCLKVIRPDRTPEIRRAEKKFPANLRPLSMYDENLIEVTMLDYLHGAYPQQIFQHLPRSFGLVETDLGTAHSTELICDANGWISQTLEQYIWENGLDQTVGQAIQSFKENWAIKPPHTRDLIPHNFVVRLEKQQAHLILIDGFGKKPWINFPFDDRVAKLRLKRRLQDFDYRIQLITERKAANNGPMHRINNVRREG